MTERTGLWNTTLTLSQFQDLSPEKDFLTPLINFNLPTQIVILVFQFLTPISIVLNAFVLVSCGTILFSGRSDRPALLYIAYNSAVDLFTIVADAIVLTGAVNPSLDGLKIENLPSQSELQTRCMIEKALVTFTMFSSLGSVLLLTIDRYLFITKPLKYNTVMTLPRAGILVIVSIGAALIGAMIYSFSVSLPWDDVCTFTHVLPLGMVIFWNVFFFVTWFAMHGMYIVILAIALRHKREMEKIKTRYSRDNSVASLQTVVSVPIALGENRLKTTSTQHFSSTSLFKDNARIKNTMKTIRYVVIILFIYSLVELPCVSVAIDDIISHVSRSFNTEIMVGYRECKHSHNESMVIGLNQTWVHTRVTLLHCYHRFMAGQESCVLVTPMPLEEAPICQMLAETSHALHLTKVFTMSLLGWILNALADPIVYAFWYPVFRRNLYKIAVRARENLSQRTSNSFTPTPPTKTANYNMNYDNNTKSNSNNNIMNPPKQGSTNRIFIIS